MNTCFLNCVNTIVKKSQPFTVNSLIERMARKQGRGAPLVERGHSQLQEAFYKMAIRPFLRFG